MADGSCVCVCVFLLCGFEMNETDLLAKDGNNLCIMLAFWGTTNI